MSSGDCLTVELLGEKSNSFGLGSRLTLNTDAGSFHRILSSAHGYMSSDQLIVHFGLPVGTTINDLVIDWPSGIRQTVNDVTLGSHYKIKESGSASAAEETESIQQPAFVENKAIDFNHRESDFDDFSSQLLLPNHVSTLGPGAAWGDANNDGRNDVFIGGAASQAG